MGQAPVTSEQLAGVEKRIREETPYWGEHFGKVITKQRDKVPLIGKPGQLELDEKLEAQRTAGLPMRAICLKARQIGISTWTQAKLIHRATLRPNYETVVVAHDKKTGGKLYKIGQTLYSNLPDDVEIDGRPIKPDVASYRRSNFMHFGDGSRDSWTRGDVWPDSSYFVDTAGEFEAGRGGTYSAVHASEVAFWDDITTKLTALKSAVPKDSETLFVIESTANGHNEFKDLWDNAVNGIGGYVPHFWPWWKEEEYRLRFLNETEKEAFVVGDPTHPYAEEEPDLVKNFGLDLEQLYWRRETIADECNGDVRKFHQEYPSTPDEAFLSTGQRVFDPYKVAGLMVKCDITDPLTPTADAPGPMRGSFTANGTRTEIDRHGNPLEVPEGSLWLPREPGSNAPDAWRIWGPLNENEKPEGEYIVAADVSGGEIEEGGKDPAYHAIQVVDHKTFEQVAEYRSRIDPDLLTTELLLAALFFNEAWIAVERTGSWGLPILRRLRFDIHYPFLYRSSRKNSTSEKTERRLGWDTTSVTKPLLLAGMQELIRTEESGIKSRLLTSEANTYVREPTGKTRPEPGKFSDLLMAYMIAQQTGRELPLRGATEDFGDEPFVAAQSRLGAYDPRYR